MRNVRIYAREIIATEGSKISFITPDWEQEFSPIGLENNGDGANGGNGNNGEAGPQGESGVKSATKLTLYSNRKTSGNKRSHTPPLFPPFNVGVLLFSKRSANSKLFKSKLL